MPEADGLLENALSKPRATLLFQVCRTNNVIPLSVLSTLDK